MSKFIVLNKTDVAKSQLETAILLFFRDEDDVSIHSLASASNQVLQNLLEHHFSRSIEEEWLQVIRDDKKAEVIKMIRKPQNFFKHADSDPEETLKFYYEATKFTIFQAVESYSKLTKNLSPVMVLFRIWFYLQNPSIIKEEEIQYSFMEYAKKFNTHDKRGFIKDILPVIEQRMRN